MPSFDPYILGVPPCICGRLSTKRHCPLCGAYTAYATKKVNQHVNPKTGTSEDFVVYRCLKCGRYYDDLGWQDDNCKAPLNLSKIAIKVRNEEARQKRIAEAQETGNEDIITPLEQQQLDEVIKLKVRYSRPLLDAEKRRAVKLGLLKKDEAIQ